MREAVTEKKTNLVNHTNRQGYAECMNIYVTDV